LQHGKHDGPLIYSNFISTLDGRIATASDTGVMQVPPEIANSRDWRLYQELAAQSSVLIVSARYIRQLACGTAQALPPVADDDLIAWRIAHQMSPQPALLILSRTLDLPLSILQSLSDRSVSVLTTATQTIQRQRIESAGAAVIVCDRASVSGEDIRNWMIAHHHSSGYAIAGCDVLDTLLCDGVLDRLFLTTHHTLLGGNSFDTMLRDVLPHPVALQLRALYLDTHERQMFADYTIGVSDDC